MSSSVYLDSFYSNSLLPKPKKAAPARSSETVDDLGLDLIKKPLPSAEEILAIQAKEIDSNDRLTQAIESGDIAQAKILILMGADVDKRNVNNERALDLAIAHKNKELVQFLVDHGAKLDLPDKYGSKPFDSAFIHGDYDLAEILIDRSKINNAVDVQGNTELHRAIHSRNKKWVELLVSNGAKFDIKDSEGNTALHLAFTQEYYDHDIAELLITKGQGDIDATFYGTTELHLAVKNKDKEKVELLVAKKARFDIPDNNFYEPTTALHLAADDLNDEILKILINNGKGDINFQDRFGSTVLHKAISQDNKKRVEFLAAHGAKTDITDNYGNTALHLAIRKRDRAIAEIIINSDKSKIDVTNSAGETALYCAVRDNDEEFIEFLVANGAKIDTQSNNLNGDTPFHLAVKKGNKKIVKFFVERILAVPEARLFKIKNEAGETLLHAAVQLNDKELAKEMSEFLIHSDKFLVFHYNNKRETPLHYAVKTKNKALVQLLVDKRARIWWSNEYGESPLFYAVQDNNIELVQLFLDGGALVGDKNKAGETPLFLAIRNNNRAMVEILIRKNKNIIKDAKNDGDTPLHCAVRYGHKELVELLINEGAEVDIKNKVGETPLFCVARCYEKEIAEILLNKYDPIFEDNPNKIDEANKAGETPLDLAICFGKEELVELLVAHGAAGAIQKALKTHNKHISDKEIAQLLMAHGAKFDKTDGEITPLLKSLRLDNRALFELLGGKKAAEKDPYFLAHSAAAAWGFGNPIRLDGKVLFTPEAISRLHGLIIIQDALEAFFKENPDELAEPLQSQFLEAYKEPFIAKKEIDPSEIEQIVSRVREKKCVCISGGTLTHDIGILIFNGCVAICNRGAGKKEGFGVVYYRPVGGITEDLIKKLMKIHPGIDSFNEVVGTLGRIGGGLVQKSQEVGNCSLASMKSTVLAFAGFLFKNSVKAKTFYKKFTAFLRRHENMKIKGRNLGLAALEVMEEQKLAAKLRPEHSSHEVYARLPRA